MTKEEVRDIVRAVLDEEKERATGQIDPVTLKAIVDILTSFGMEEADRKELRADLIHLRKWRQSVEQAQGLALKTVISIIVTGFIGAVWLGIKAILALKS